MGSGERPAGNKVTPPANPDLLARFRKGDIRALSRLISQAENKEPSLTPLLATLFEGLTPAKVIGLTGPPGAGKSTLTNDFVRFTRQQAEKIAVVAVDPVSPFTGGALLGDRIRLVDHFNDPGVFIRSLSTRGKLGGLSLATREVVHLLEAFGFGRVVIETVGVGQSEVDIRKIADVTVVVLVPEWGDAIQTLKAGLLEIGDIFVVNKADRDGADRLASELSVMLEIAGKKTTPVLMTTQKDPASLERLFKTVTGYFVSHGAMLKERRVRAVKFAILELMEAFVLNETERWVQGHVLDEKNPYEFLARFLEQNPPGSLFRL